MAKTPEQKHQEYVVRIQEKYGGNIVVNGRLIILLQ